MEGLFKAWGKILAGRKPLLSLELTRECPLTCPGCYAYGDTHLGGALTLRQVRDLTGQALIDGVLALVREHAPLHLSIVGGEPLVRFRELDVLLPKLAAMGVHTQLVTSAVRPIPESWASIPRLSICVSIDGLQPEHDLRRKPATYDRILKHIAGHQVTIHCTVTRQQTERPGYLREFAAFWSGVPETRRIWFSLYTPQMKESSAECLGPADRAEVTRELRELRREFPLIKMHDRLIDVLEEPPASPDECLFAKSTTCVSADLKSRVTPCQFGGEPDCKRCGCMASAGFGAIDRYRLPIGMRIGTIFEASMGVGRALSRTRRALAAR